MKFIFKSNSWPKTINNEFIKTWFKNNDNDEILLPLNIKNAIKKIKNNSFKVKTESIKEEICLDYKIDDLYINNKELSIFSLVEKYADNKILKHLMLYPFTLEDNQIDAISLKLAYTVEPDQLPLFNKLSDGVKITSHIFWPMDWNNIPIEEINNFSFHLLEPYAPVMMYVKESKRLLRNEELLIKLEKTEISYVLQTYISSFVLICEYLDKQEINDLIFLYDSLDCVIPIFGNYIGSLMILLFKMRLRKCFTCKNALLKYIERKNIHEKPELIKEYDAVRINRYHCSIYPINGWNLLVQFNFECPVCKSIISENKFIYAPIFELSDLDIINNKLKLLDVPYFNLMTEYLSKQSQNH